MITEEMKSTLLDIETNNPEGIQNLKALLKNYSDIINKDQSTLSEEEEQSLCDLQDNIMILIFGPLYSQFKFEYIQSDTIMDEEETFIEDLCKFYFGQQMKDYIIFLLMIRLPQGTAITIFGIGSRPLTKDTVLTIENTQLIPILI